MMDEQKKERRNPLKDPRYRFRLFTGYQPTEPYTKEEYDQAEAESFLGSGIPGEWLDYIIGNEPKKPKSAPQYNSKTKVIYNTRSKG